MRFPFAIVSVAGLLAASAALAFNEPGRVVRQHNTTDMNTLEREMPFKRHKDSHGRMDQSKRDVVKDDQQAGDLDTTEVDAATGDEFRYDTSDQQAGKASGDLSPKDVCKSLVDAAKSNDKTRLKSFSIGWASKLPLSWWKDADCGSEHVSGTNAFVETGSTTAENDTKKYIPFVQHGGRWKFDARTFNSFYRTG